MARRSLTGNILHGAIRPRLQQELLDYEESRRRWPAATAATALLIALIVLGSVFYIRHPHRAVALTERDIIVLADFRNNTGDQVFDDALKEGWGSRCVSRPS